MSPKRKGKSHKLKKKLLKVVPQKSPNSGDDDNVHPWEDKKGGASDPGDSTNIHPWEDKKKSA